MPKKSIFNEFFASGIRAKDGSAGRNLGRTGPLRRLMPILVRTQQEPLTGSQMVLSRGGVGVGGGGEVEEGC